MSYSSILLVGVAIAAVAYALAAVISWRRAAPAAQKVLPALIVVLAGTTAVIVYADRLPLFVYPLSAVIASTVWGLLLLAVHTLPGIAAPSPLWVRVFGVVLGLALIAYTITLI